MGVMVIMGINNLFLQLLLLYHMDCEVCFSNSLRGSLSLKHDRSHIDLEQLYIICPFGAVLCMYWLCLYMILHNEGEFLRLDCVLHLLALYSHVLAYYVCVCLLCVCLLWHGGARGPMARQGEEMGGGARTSSPRKLSVLQKPELQPVKTMRGTRETLAHGG